MSQLNAEIIGTQKSRYDLLKWKMIAFGVATRKIHISIIENVKSTPVMGADPSGTAT